MDETDELWYLKELDSTQWEEPLRRVFLFYSDEFVFERERCMFLRAFVRDFLEDDEQKLNGKMSRYVSWCMEKRNYKKTSNYIVYIGNSYIFKCLGGK